MILARSFLFDYGWELMVFVVLPIFFLLLALAYMQVLKTLEKLLPNNHWLKHILQQQTKSRDVNWLADKMNALFACFLLITLILLTFIYT